MSLTIARHVLAFRWALLPLLCCPLVGCGQANDASPTAQDGTPELKRSTQTMRLEHYRAPCMGFGPRGCFVTDDGLFYSGIEDFEYQWGFTYTIEVDVFDVKDPPADGSSLRYKLARVVDSDRPTQPGFDVVIFDGSLIHTGARTAFSLFNEKDFTCASEALCTMLDEKLNTLQSASDPLTACFTLTFQDGALPVDPLSLTDIQDDAEGWGCQ